MKQRLFLAALCAALLLYGLSGCADKRSAQSAEPQAPTSEPEEGRQESDVRTGVVPEQVLQGRTGTIHYSYYLPHGYDESREYPLMMAMPGYDMMWFGPQSSGSNLNWSGFLCWTEREMIVVSAQLSDWGETSARQAVELTEYFIDNFSVDKDRVYAAGYSAGGQTMSRAVSMRPDLYAAYLHVSSQWDGEYAPVAENGVGVYIFMAENDEYYGSGRAWEAYYGLRQAYIDAGVSRQEDVLQILTPDDEWFALRGVTANYHGGGNAVFDEPDILEWIVCRRKGE